MYWTTYKDGDSSMCYYEFVAVAVDDYIYSFSGSYWSLEPIDIHILNTHTLIWSLLPLRTDINGKTLKPPDVPIKRSGHTVVAYDKKIYLWGGKNKKEMCDTLYCFDTKTLNWSRPQVTGIKPRPRRDHSACISNHLMYLFGGYESNTRQLLRDVHCLDLKTMNWRYIITTGEIPSPRQLHAATVVDNRMYIYGGWRSGECTDFNDFMYLDLESNQWHRPETTGNIPIGNRERRLFVHNDIIYIFKSSTGDHFGKLNYLYSLNTKLSHWNLIKLRGKLPKKHGDSFIVIGDKMFFICAYILRFHAYRNTIHVLDFNPSLKTLATMAIIENGLDFSCLPTKLRCEIDSIKQHSESNSNDKLI